MNIFLYIIFSFFCVFTINIVGEQLYIQKQLTFHKYTHLNQGYQILDTLTLYNPTFEFCIGIPKQCLQVSLDTTSSVTWISAKSLEANFNNTFDPEKSTSFEILNATSSFLLEGGAILGNLVKDIPSPFDSVESTQTKFVFALMKSTDLKQRIIFKDGTIGIMKKLRDNNIRGNESTSYLNYLKDGSAINKKIFYFEIDDYDKGKITFGYNSEYQKYDTCKGNSQLYNYSWSCKIKSIIYNKEELYGKENENVFFETMNPYIVAPYEGGHFLLNQFIKGNKEYCRVQTEFNYDFLKCEKGFILKNLKDIIIDLGEVKFYIYAKNIFQYREKFDDYISLLVVTKNDLNNWAFGLPSIKNKIIIFDQENDEIGVIDKMMSSNKNKNFITLWYVLLFIVIIVILLIAGIYFRRKYLLGQKDYIDFKLVQNK